MPRLNFDDTLGVAEAVAAAGAPKAAAHYPRFPYLQAAIFADLRAVQDDRLSYSRQASIGLRDLQRRHAGTTDRLVQEAVASQIKEHHVRTERRMAGFAERTAAASDKMETDGRCVEAVHGFLRETVGQGKRLRDALPPAVALLAAGLTATIEAKRIDLIGNSERRAGIEARPALSSDLKSAISRAVRAEAEKGRPSFNPRARGGDDPSKLADELLIKLHAGASQTVNQGGGVPFLIWLLRDQIEVRLHALVDEVDLTGAISDAEQVAALASLDAERLALEREEEALIRMAEAEGMAIARRADADPRAVLMVEVC